MQAINRHVEHVFDPSRKDKHWGRRKLARDRGRKPGIIAASILTALPIARPIISAAGRCSTCAI